MCKVKMPKMPDVAAITAQAAAEVAAKPPQVASYDNAEALNQADIEARLRRRRAGPAANVLTSPTGIPVTATMGGVAA
jgi:hypothetical protein